LGIIGGVAALTVLKRLCPDGETGYMTGEAYANKSKLRVLFGDQFLDEVRGRTVIDFGCGHGDESVEMALAGARRVLGVDISDRYLEIARGRAAAAGVSDRCAFMRVPDERADIVVSLDSFEHFSDPASILRIMDDYLKPDGRVFATFGPTWYHPLGGHLFSVFPWAHLLFTERSLLRWRKTFHPEQTATSFEECGLNRITISRFERVIADSPFKFESFEARPIRGIRWLSHRLLREFGTSTVRCTLTKRAAGVAAPVVAA